jgi:hypothetical protein
MQPDPGYLHNITVDMTEDNVKDIVHTAFGSSWEYMNELKIWTHYDNALLYCEKMSFDKLSTMIQKQHSLPAPSAS